MRKKTTSIPVNTMADSFGSSIFIEKMFIENLRILLKANLNGFEEVASQYLELAKSTEKFSRFEIITKAFREILERNYTTLKRPADYAEKLNITTPYLNECVKNTTGYSDSYHVQQRITAFITKSFFKQKQFWILFKFIMLLLPNK